MALLESTHRQWGASGERAETEYHPLWDLSLTTLWNSHEDRTFQDFYTDSSTIVKFCNSGYWVPGTSLCFIVYIVIGENYLGHELQAKECLLARGLRVWTGSAESQRRAGQRGHHWGMPPGQMWALLCSHSARHQAIRQTQQIGQGVSLTMKYDGLTG